MTRMCRCGTVRGRGRQVPRARARVLHAGLGPGAQDSHWPRDVAADSCRSRAVEPVSWLCAEAAPDCSGISGCGGLAAIAPVMGSGCGAASRPYRERRG